MSGAKAVESGAAKFERGWTPIVTTVAAPLGFSRAVAFCPALKRIVVLNDKRGGRVATGSVRMWQRSKTGEPNNGRLIDKRSRRHRAGQCTWECQGPHVHQP
jgi:hypothetical protein